MNNTPAPKSPEVVRCTVCRCIALERIIAATLAKLPPTLTNTPESIPERVAYFVKGWAEAEREVLRLQRVADLARDAVEAGAIEECYLSLLRDALRVAGSSETVG